MYTNYVTNQAWIKSSLFFPSTRPLTPSLAPKKIEEIPGYLYIRDFLERLPRTRQIQT